VINGGIADLEQAKAHLAHVDGVMMGRAAYQSPWLLAAADAELFGDAQRAWTRHEVVRAYFPYVARELAKGAPLNVMTKHLLGLFNGLPGARAFRRHLSENATKPGAGIEVLRAALALVPESIAESAAA
jgi:tRNA-dihydrouridine synthase A